MLLLASGSGSGGCKNCNLIKIYGNTDSTIHTTQSRLDTLEKGLRKIVLRPGIERRGRYEIKNRDIFFLNLYLML